MENIVTSKKYLFSDHQMDSGFTRSSMRYMTNYQLYKKSIRRLAKKYWRLLHLV